MKILNVKINNILSIESAEVNFDDSGLVLVKGWDYDHGRANGAGKTAVFNALSFALFDDLPRKITATEIVRRGCKSGSVEVSLELGGDRYVVKRSRPKGVTFHKNGTLIDLTQVEWEDKLKLNYKQFMMVAYCAQGTDTRFLSVNDANKKQFLLQLLDLDKFSNAKKTSDLKVKDFTAELDTFTSKSEAIMAKISAYEESLVDVTEVSLLIDEGNKIISGWQQELLKAQSIAKPDLSKYQKIEDDIVHKQKSFIEAKTRRNLLLQAHRKLSSKAHVVIADTCDSCGSKLDNAAAKAAHQKDMDQRANELASIKTDIDSCDQTLSSESAVSQLAEKVREKKKADSSAYDTASLYASDLRSKIERKQLVVENLTLKLQNNSELLSKIEVLNKALASLTQQISDTQSKIELYKTVSAMYSPTGAQAYILDSIVESFNSSVDEFVKLLWSNASYQLNSYKENDSGNVTAKFSETLSMGGKEVSIGSLSGGEYRALSLCVDFALMSVMEKQFGIYVSPIVLDEPFDGLDSEGRELIVELLEHLAANRLIVVIDHSSEVKSMFSKTLMVEKRGGVSSITLET